jgi:hypothetical protein
MTALEYLKARGEPETEALAVRAGTTLAYFKQIAYRHRRPSPDLAQRLAAESFGALSAADLVFVELKAPGERQDKTADERSAEAAEIMLRDGATAVVRT